MTKKKAYCSWDTDSEDEGLYNTDCGKELVNLNGATVEDVGYMYCPYCGCIIKIKI